MDSDVLQQLVKSSLPENYNKSEVYDKSALFKGDECEDFDYKKQILSSAIRVSNKINESMITEEKAKRNMRIWLLVFLVLILMVSVAYVAWLIYQKGIGKIHISDGIIYGFFTYIIAEVFAILRVMTKYISENMLLNTFGSVTQKLLDFLVNDDKKDK